ncbi:AI-2E family transporter, partial [Streptomyces tateyamensis]
AGYAWRLLVLAAALYVVLLVVGRLDLPVVAVFGALVITSMLRPVADLIARALPRAAAVAGTVGGSLLLAAGGLALQGESVASD